MKAAVISDGRLDRDPRASALGWSLRHVGHRVVAIDLDGTVTWADDAVGVPPRIPVGAGKARTMARAVQPAAIEKRGRRRRLAAALEASGAHLAYPMSADLHVDLLTRTSVPLVRQPTWPSSSRDMIARAPHDPSLSSSPAGPGLTHHHMLDPSAGFEPVDGRHRGRRVVLLYRHTPTTPGRYLHRALERAGVEVHAPGPELEQDGWRGFDAIVVVESPYPPPVIHGPRPEVPVLFWVHHGEHHLGPNLRLVDRLLPDAVLLAHSWHLAHRFPVPVHRFPFGVPRELFGSVSRPWHSRSYDVAMVGVGLQEGGGRYGQRAEMAGRLVEALGDRALFPGRVPPEELAEIYADARVVINDGGTRHHPITMRVFEATGAGALLLTEEQPGTDVLFSPNDYAVLDPEEVADQVRHLVTDSTSPNRAASARKRAFSHHTYDHRVDELLAIVDVTQPGRWNGRPSPPSPLAHIVDDDIEVDTVATDSSSLADELPDRTVWDLDRVLDRLGGGGRVDAAVLTSPRPDLDLVVSRTRQYVYATDRLEEEVREAMLRHHPEATFERRNGYLRADTATTERYRYAGEKSR